MRSEFGSEHEHGNGRGLRIYAPEFLRLWYEHCQDYLSERQVDPLDEYKRRLYSAKAEHAEIELQKTRGELIPFEDSEFVVETIATRIRNSIETIQQISSEAGQVLEDTCDEIANIIEEFEGDTK